MIIAPLAKLLNLDVVTSHYVRATAMCWLFAWSLASFGLLMSTVWSEKGKVAMSVGGLALLMYVLNVVSGLQDSLSWLKYLSFFSYLNIQNVVVKDHWSWTAVLVFVGFSLACSLIGAWWFNRRDIAV
jgi:ABC-2 type transport system permease protein